MISQQVRIIYLYGTLCFGVVGVVSCSSHNLDFGPPKITEDTFSFFEVYELYAEDPTTTTIDVVKPIFQSIKLTCDDSTDNTPNKLYCSKSTNSVTVNVYYDEKQSQIIISELFPSKETNSTISFDKDPLMSITEPGNTSSHLWGQDELLNTDFIAVRDAILVVRDAILTTFQEHDYSLKRVDKEK